MTARTYVIVMILIAALMISVCLADETLVGYWAFEEGEGDVVEDLSDAGNDGVVNGQTEWMAGKNGDALAFFKDGQGHVEIVDSETLDISDQITMSAWIKPSEIYIGDVWQERNCVVAKKRAYYLDIMEAGNLACYLYGAQPQEWLVGKTDMTSFIDTWVHVATVYDGKEHKLYINGELDVAVAKSGAITVNNDSLFIGWVDNNRYFDGLIDDVMIWSRGLSVEELTDFLSVSSKDKLATCWATLKRL